jgi:hypothetical protein
MEIYKDIVGYEGIYQVSNMGNVKSLSRIILIRGKYSSKSTERILKACANSNGYLTVNLYNNSKINKKVHQIVAETFLNHIPCGFELVVNHKDFNKTNNKTDNLEIVTTRENANRKHLVSTSKYVGVSFNKSFNKWVSQIFVNGKPKYLGYYNTEIDAHNAYQLKLKEIVI